LPGHHNSDCITSSTCQNLSFCPCNAWSQTLLVCGGLHNSKGTNFSPGSRTNVCVSRPPSSGINNTVVTPPQTTLKHHAYGISQSDIMGLQVCWIWPARQSRTCTAHHLLMQWPTWQVGSMAGQPQRGNSPAGPPTAPASV